MPCTSAHACGAIGIEVEALLPAAGAVDVPTNTALITSSNESEAVFSLRKTAADQDGGSEEVPLSVTCHRGMAGGAVCVAKAELEPMTHYEWSAAEKLYEGVGQEDSSDLFRDWSGFTTGEGPAEPTEPSGVSVEVTGNDWFESAPCGDDHYVELSVNPSALMEPIVVNIRGFTPGYVMQAKVLTPGGDVQTLPLYGLGECAQVEGFDFAGESHELTEVCPDNELAPTLVKVDGTREPLNAASDAQPTANTDEAVLLTDAGTPADSRQGEPETGLTATPEFVGENASMSGNDAATHPGNGVNESDEGRGGCALSGSSGSNGHWIFALFALAAIRRRRQGAAMLSTSRFGKRA